METIKADPTTLRYLSRIEPELQARQAAWLSLTTHRGEIARRQEHVRLGEAVAAGRTELTADPKMALQQADLSRDYLPTLQEQLQAYENAFEAADRTVIETLRQLEAQLRRTADAPVPSASPFDDAPSEVG